MNEVLAEKQKCKRNKHLFLARLCSCLSSHYTLQNKSSKPSSRYLLCEDPWGFFGSDHSHHVLTLTVLKNARQASSLSFIDSPAPPLTGQSSAGRTLSDHVYIHNTYSTSCLPGCSQTMLVACSWIVPMLYPLLRLGFATPPPKRLTHCLCPKESPNSID